MQLGIQIDEGNVKELDKIFKDMYKWRYSDITTTLMGQLIYWLGGYKVLVPPEQNNYITTTCGLGNSNGIIPRKRPNLSFVGVFLITKFNISSQFVCTNFNVKVGPKSNNSKAVGIKSNIFPDSFGIDPTFLLHYLLTNPTFVLHCLVKDA